MSDKEYREYIIIEPLKEHINNVKKLNEVNTIFKATWKDFFSS